MLEFSAKELKALRSDAEYLYYNSGNFAKKQKHKEVVKLYANQCSKDQFKKAAKSRHMRLAELDTYLTKATTLYK